MKLFRWFNFVSVAGTCVVPLLAAQIFLLCPAHAQRVGANVGGEKRVALVIGNNDYKSVPRLERAVADARSIGVELGRLGFEVISRQNADRRSMNQAVGELVDKVSGGGVGVIFYAGHGVQVSGVNFLLPVDIKVARTEDLLDEAIDLGRVMERLSAAKPKFTLMIVDACRDNPFPRIAGRSIGGSRGLTIPSAPDGLMVVYSAGINEQALDKLDERDRNPNGLFTREFLKQLRQPGVRVDEMVRRVRTSVREQAQSVGHSQNPAFYDQSNGDFYFVLPKNGAPIATITSTTSEPDSAAVELAFWNSVKDSRNPGEFQTYIDKYPQGQFAALAKVRIGLFAPVAPATVTTPDVSKERSYWDSVKDTKNPDELRAYIDRFPQGSFAILAKARLQSLSLLQHLPDHFNRIVWNWPSDRPALLVYDDQSKGMAFQVGAVVQAAAEGKVVYVGSGLKGYGNLILIRHDDEFMTAYANNSGMFVREGELVKKGQKLGLAGVMNGESRFHFQVRRFGKPIDSQLYAYLSTLTYTNSVVQ